FQSSAERIVRPFVVIFFISGRKMAGTAIVQFGGLERSEVLSQCLLVRRLGLCRGTLPENRTEERGNNQRRPHDLLHDRPLEAENQRHRMAGGNRDCIEQSAGSSDSKAALMVRN